MMNNDYQMLINGKWINSSSNEKLATINPYNQKEWATIPYATEQDVDDAVSSAREAFKLGWNRTTGIQRATLMNRLADLLDQDAERMAELETKDNGKVIRETKNQMHFAARSYRFFAGYADKLYGEVLPLDNPELFDYTIREPIGVAALIISWNSPMSILANKLAPALAAGCTVVVKPSEHASVTTLEFGKLIEKAGFPKGVVNIVTGEGRVGKSLISNPDIDRISFTGGTHTGKLISETASKNLIPVTLELGGKSPNIIFDDAEINKAVIGAVAGIYAASGQTCIAGSRLLVQKSVYEQVIDKLVKKTKSIKLGNPLKETTEMGPAANRAQYQRILSMIEEGEKEGAKIVLGGEPIDSNSLNSGYFISPTIFANVDNNMGIAQKEIFGPVLSVIPFEGEEQAVRIANDSDFGLASGIWTTDMKRAHRMTRAINSGNVWVNTYRTAAAQAPFGGMKMSGYGRERSHHALLEYISIKNVMINMSDEVRDPFSIQT